MDGAPLFSKKQARRFPDPGEIEAAIAARMASASPDGS
jgi:hypothetical protein